MRARSQRLYVLLQELVIFVFLLVVIASFCTGIPFSCVVDGAARFRSTANRGGWYVRKL
jgi:hypothetical protein